MFIDEAKIFVKAGNGGNGCLSFRREKNVPKGGPDGGDGGKGGDVFIEASPDIVTLIDFQYRSHFNAQCGEHGKGNNRTGRNGKDLTIKVPVGTVVKKVVVRFNAQKSRDAEEKIIADLLEPGQKMLVAKGGMGGRGNAAFKSATNRAPTTVEEGEAGEEAVLHLELKLIADVGIVGYPNAGKSTLISKLSNAHPKIAAYPFTTLEPHLGIVKNGTRSFVLADLPGLIEGAHKGKGLGDRFLRHAERTKVILHVVDLNGYEDRDPVTNFHAINSELESYSPSFKEKMHIVAANKIDLKVARDNLGAFMDAISKEGYRVIPVSGLTEEGLEILKREIFKILEK